MTTENESNESQRSHSYEEACQKLLNDTFNNVNQIGCENGVSKLFPNGIQSVHLEIDNEVENGKSRFVLSIQAASPGHSQITTKTIDAADFNVSFNSEGHKVIAYIAQKDLQENTPEIWTKVQKVLDDGNRELTEAATYPDEIRSQQPNTGVFHYIDIPYQDNGLENPPLPNAPHVLSKLQEYTDALNAEAGGSQGMVDSLSWVIHLFGDVHQPLHCIDHISELHRDGDRGGNLFKLKGSAKNLHSIWDSSVNISFPGEDEEITANKIRLLHARINLANDLKVTETEKWARTSFKLAKDHAYSPLIEDPQNPPELSPEYLQNMEKIGQKQAALAGYRLADRLKEIFS